MSKLLERFLWAIGLLIIALGIIFIFLSANINKESPWFDLVREVGITLCSAGVISFLYEVLIRSELLKDYSAVLNGIVNSDATRFGVAKIFQSRDEKIKRGGYLLPDLIPGAREEIMFLGIGLTQLIGEQRKPIREALRRGNSVRMLVMNPQSKYAEAIETSLGEGRLIDSIKGTMKSIADFSKDLNHEGLLGKFEVRCYDHVPTFGAIAIDRSAVSGRLVIELYGFGVSGSACPGFDLLNETDGIYSFFSSQMDSIWNGAKPVTLP